MLALVTKFFRKLVRKAFASENIAVLGPNILNIIGLYLFVILVEFHKILLSNNLVSYPLKRFNSLYAIEALLISYILCCTKHLKRHILIDGCASIKI